MRAGRKVLGLMLFVAGVAALDNHLYLGLLLLVTAVFVLAFSKSRS